MDILIIHHGEPWYFIAATSILNGLKKKYSNLNVTFSVSEDNYPFIQYNKKVKNIVVGDKLVDGKFDKVINFTPELSACGIASHADAKDSHGYTEVSGSFDFCDTYAEEIYDAIYVGRNSNKTILQLIYRLAGLTWRGEGYDLAYYPKTKVKKKKTGIAIENDFLRTFVKSNLNLVMSDLWHIPMKKNLMKRIDEINRCKNIVTDDLFCLHASIALRKYVEYIDIDNRLSTKIEFFGQGNILRLNA